MTERNKPMPLSELPAYIESVRGRGQNGDIPVVDMGRIIDDSPRFRFKPVAFASVLCLLLLVGGVYVSNSVDDITIESDGASNASIQDIVSNEGAQVFSVMQEEDGSYKVRVFNFGGIKSLVERLKENKKLKKVELKD